MIASLLGILGGFILIMFAGLVSMINFLPHYKEYKDD